MIKLQVQQKDTHTGKTEVLFDIETKEDSRQWMTNELHLMYEDRITDKVEIKVLEIAHSA